MTCHKCASEIHINAKFCGVCGQTMIVQETQEFEKPLKKVLIFFILLMVYIVVTHFIELHSNYVLELAVDLCFAGLILLFAIIDWKSYLHLFRIPKVEWRWVGLIICLSPIFAFGVEKFANYYNQYLVGQEFIGYYSSYLDTPIPFLFAIISVGVFPALFEELAFRGIFFHELRKVISVQGTILLTAIFFFLMHLTLIPILWILPIGLLTGYMRYKKNTLWYGILLHFTYNSSFVFFEYFELYF